MARALAHRRAGAEGSARPLLAAEGAWLTPAQLEVCWRTLEEAEAGRDVWLVVQHADLEEDLALHVLRPREGGATVREALVLARAPWDHRSLREALSEGLGRRVKVRDVVIQTFQRRTQARLIYEPPERREGLLAWLPPGALLRDVREVRAPDGERLTVALVIEDAEFLPGDCSGCGDPFGHADTGRAVFAVLAGSEGILHRLALTDALGDATGRPQVLRFPCGGSDPQARDAWRAQLPRRRPVTLLRPEDLDGDGNAWEFRLPRTIRPCERGEVRFGVDPAGRRLYWIRP